MRAHTRVGGPRGEKERCRSRRPHMPFAVAMGHTCRGGALERLAVSQPCSADPRTRCPLVCWCLLAHAPQCMGCGKRLRAPGFVSPEQVVGGKAHPCQSSSFQGPHGFARSRTPRKARNQEMPAREMPPDWPASHRRRSRAPPAPPRDRLQSLAGAATAGVAPVHFSWGCGAPSPARRWPPGRTR